MSSKIVKAIIAIIEDESNQGEHVANIAEQILDKVEELQGEQKRIAVVGQIQYGGGEDAFPLVLGPYTARGTLNTEEKWRKAAESHTTSRSDGGSLAWDTTAKTGHGRYMLAPMFKNARAAWDFYRPSRPEVEEEIKEIFSTIRGSEIDVGPACLCGFKGATCHKHPEGR